MIAHFDTETNEVYSTWHSPAEPKNEAGMRPTRMGSDILDPDPKSRTEFTDGEVAELQF